MICPGTRRLGEVALQPWGGVRFRALIRSKSDRVIRFLSRPRRSNLGIRRRRIHASYLSVRRVVLIHSIIDLGSDELDI